MLRLSARVLVVAGLVMLGWVVGHAQQSPAPGDFELAVTVNNDGAAITCVRGCNLTWGPKVVPANDPVEFHVPTPTVSGYVTPDGCVGGRIVLGSCRIFGWKK
jgi:hypothetical protein